MRVEEKDVDGLDLEHQEEQQEVLLAETKEDELPKLAGEEVRDLDEERSLQLMTAMRLIFERKHINVTHLRMPQRETLALEALQAAVNGRSTNIDKFVYASDRRSMLEQALAVLQPNLTSGAQQQLAAMGADFRILSKQVTELRDSLMNLEDGQDELMANEHIRFHIEAAAGDTVDKPKPPKGDPDAPRPPSTLSKGAEVKIEPKPTTLSSGPEATREAAPSTLSKGAEVKLEPKETTLSKGPEAKYEPGPTTLLSGPEAKLERGPTTLGDPTEIDAEAKKRPWWKRVIRG